MRKSTKAALLSGLIFPGLGHMVLKKYLCGSILMLSTLLALSVVVTVVSRRVLTVLEEINGGGIPFESGEIATLVSSSISSGDDSIVNAAVIGLLVCWLAGIIDSYRVGSTLDKQNI